MKLYYAPLACSLADHIALIEVGAAFEREAVDLKTKRTASGVDIATLAGKPYVPILVLDDGTVLTENIAILDWIATRYPFLGNGAGLGRTRLIEALAFISTEIHRAFKPFWHMAPDAEKSAASAIIQRHFAYLAGRLEGDYLLADTPGVADYYLFVMLLWASRFGVPVPDQIDALANGLASRPAVKAAMEAEGLI